MAVPSRIGLTGGIGTGKSFVLGHLARCGVPTLDTDAVSHAVVRRGTPAFGAVVARFGPAVVARDGELDRQALGRIVFADETARRDLEAIVHPAVWRAVDAWLEVQGAPGVVAVPLLFETGAESRFDRVMLTDCAAETQVARVMARDGLTAEAVAARVSAQMPAQERRRRAHAVIDTSGTREATVEALESVWRDWGLGPLTPRTP